MNKSLLPKIRFKEFADFYYKTTFNKFYNKGKSGGTPSTKNKDFYNGEISFLSIKDVTNQGKYIFETEKTITRKGLLNSSAWLVPKNSLIYSIYASVGFPTINKIPLATSQAFFSMEINNLYFSIEYLYYLLLKFKKKELNKYIIKQTQPNLSKEIINQFIFKLPNLQEQNKIADFFTIIDKKIELVKEQLSLLAKQKQYYLNNMFANEKGYPQIRFKEFINENNFQKVKLRTIATIWGGSTPSTKNKKLWLNEIPFITPNFITKNNSMLLNKYDRFITDKNFNFSKKNDILLTCRAPVGVVTINNLEKCWFSQGIKNIRTGKLINHKYLYYWLYNNKNVLITNSFGTTFLEISNKDLENIQIYITCSLQEQTKIAHFFSIIDRKIELVKEQLSLLAKQKQYYLNNMFI